VASRAPLGFIGGLGGGIGALPIVSAARDLATRVTPGPRLPGAERLAGDLKAATFAEAAVFLLVIPLFALAFGGFLPRRLEGRAAIEGLSFEWIGGVFSCAFLLWRLGLPALWALAAGFAAAGGFATLLVRARSRPARTNRFRAPGVESIGRLAATAAAWELARRASSGFDPDFAPLCVVALLAAIPFFVQTFAHGARSRA
jgi:hypothetical protein